MVLHAAVDVAFMELARFLQVPPQIAIKRALAIIAAAPEAAKDSAGRHAKLKKAMRSPVTNERGDDEGSYFGGWPGHAHQ